VELGSLILINGRGPEVRPLEAGTINLVIGTSIMGSQGETDGETVISLMEPR